MIDNLADRWLKNQIPAVVIGILTMVIKGASVLSLCYIVYGMLLYTILRIDWKEQQIPNRWNLGILMIAIPILLLQKEGIILGSIGGAVVVSFPMLLVDMIRPHTFGGGDIKLMAASGIVLGIGNTVVAFCIGVLLAGGYSMYLIQIKKINRKTAIAFGPYLCLGCYIAVLFGNEIINWYVGH